VNLTDAFEDVLREHGPEFQSRLKRWHKMLTELKKNVRGYREHFHQWGPLRVYVSTSGSPSEFSLRFHGHAVGKLLVRRKKVYLKYNKNIQGKNNEFFPEFPLTWPVDLTKESRSIRWRLNSRVEYEASRFRKYFTDLEKGAAGKYKVLPEHQIESKFIDEMMRSGSKRFGGGVPGLEIQPVTIQQCPLQFPLPISGYSGVPKWAERKGNIDILARRWSGSVRKYVLSVWELKAPHVYGKPASQAYIYALTLLKILRSEKGQDWYRLFGFKGKLPHELEIEAVVVITEDVYKSYLSEKSKLEKSGTKFVVGDDRITLYVVCYKYDDKRNMLKIVKNTLSV
jgi:hypothetical protein